MSCITEILKLKGDKEVLLPTDEEEKVWIAVEGGGTYKDYEYIIVLNHHGHRCGYVALPSGHPSNDVGMKHCSLRKLDEFNYDALDIECHGGLTFGGNDHGLKNLLSTPCTDNWIGFDCGHAWDRCDVEAVKKYYGEDHAERRRSFFEAMDHNDAILRSYPYVEQNCISIIEQLIEKAA